MIESDDLKVNDADDIIIEGDDISIEPDYYINAFRNGQRRLSARSSDYILTPEIVAGIETIIQKNINTMLLSEIEFMIRSALSHHSLFKTTDYDVLFNDNEDKIGIIISFKLPQASFSEKNSFAVFVDKENQRSYI